MKKSEIEWMPIAGIRPYDKNPRKNDEAVDAVAESIVEFGFKNPIIVDSDRVIICGHTRLKAAKKLGLKEVPVIIADDLTPEQVKAFRIADNSTGMLSEWDFDLLEDEIDDLLEIDMSRFGFFLTDDEEVDFSDLESRLGKKSGAQLEFEDKFKPKHTTDDCFTPPEVYDAVKEWVSAKYHHEGAIVRPFYPGGDYRSFDYPPGCLVLDNPPFSIATEIVRFYNEKKIDYFLFANHLTCFQSVSAGAKVVIVGIHVVYENGANINTSFITSLGANDVEIASSLYAKLKDVQSKEDANLGSYVWPDNMISAALLEKLSRSCEFSIPHIYYVNSVGGQHIFGGGALVSDRVAEELKAEKLKVGKQRKLITLTPDQEAIVEKLNREDRP